MRQELEKSLYEAMPEQRERVYTIVDLEYLSAGALYTGDLPKMGPGGFGALPSLSGGGSSQLDISGFESKPIGSISDFKPASAFKLGPGIARKMPEAFGMIEKIRAPGYGDKNDADHLNYEYRIPGIKNPLVNIHINLFDKED